MASEVYKTLSANSETDMSQTDFNRVAIDIHFQKLSIIIINVKSTIVN